jgi:hypothetical protein
VSQYKCCTDVHVMSHRTGNGPLHTKIPAAIPEGVEITEPTFASNVIRHKTFYACLVYDERETRCDHSHVKLGYILGKDTGNTDNYSSSRLQRQLGIRRDAVKFSLDNVLGRRGSLAVQIIECTSLRR